MVYEFCFDHYGAHSKIVNLVGNDRRVLDVGCASGYVAEQLMRNGCTVVGIEANPEAAELARNHCKSVIVADLDYLGELPYEERYFDAMIFLDVLEHLKEPVDVLKKLKKYLTDDGKIYVSVPNVANWKVRLKLLIGRFEYQDVGILDRTHLRFFDIKSATGLVADAGFDIIKFDVSCGVPLAPRTGRAGYIISRLMPNLFALQFLIVAKKRFAAANSKGY